MRAASAIPRRWARRLGAAATLLLGACAGGPATAASDSGAQWALRGDARQVSGRGPLAEAAAVAPGLVEPPRSALSTQLELWHTLRMGRPFALAARARLDHERPRGGGGDDSARLLELFGSADLGDWQLSAGRKVLGWDVGWAFRPNDVVQQEARRALLAQTPEGRPLLQAERFGSDWALALVLAQPQHWNATPAASRGAAEAAWAARGWWRQGPVDWHAFARHGRHTGPSLGAAVQWVAGDELALHASLRAVRRHDGWLIDPQAAPLVTADPWRQATQRGGSQALLGAQWTGASGLSLLVEAWHDGSAMSDAQWRDWAARNRTLASIAQQPAWRAAAAGNLAWQAAPLQASGLRRDNLFVRGGWQSGDWTIALDALLAPADRGRVLTASLQFKAERWRLDAVWRVFGGPPDAVFAALPVRRLAMVAATWAF